MSCLHCGKRNDTNFGDGKGGGSGPSITTQTFTAGGTYTPTAGMRNCYVEVVGGGGGGGGAAGGATAAAAGGGGGAGEYRTAYFSASQIGASQTVTIGIGGTAGANTGGTGGTGGASIFGALPLISSNGGVGGGGAAAVTGVGSVSGGAGGTGGTGGTAFQGNTGQPGLSYYVSIPAGLDIITNAFALGGFGANSKYGNGGRGGSQAVGADATGRGAGGGGGAQFANATGRAGGVGTGGIVIITEYIN